MFNKQIFYVLAFAVLSLWSAYQLIPAWTDYQDSKRQVANLDERVLSVQAENENLRADIHKLRTQNRAIERVAREKFGWARPNETIYDFSPTMH